MKDLSRRMVEFSLAHTGHVLRKQCIRHGGGWYYSGIWYMITS
jgi:hypothetical protein